MSTLSDLEKKIKRSRFNGIRIERDVFLKQWQIVEMCSCMVRGTGSSMTEALKEYLGSRKAKP